MSDNSLLCRFSRSESDRVRLQFLSGLTLPGAFECLTGNIRLPIESNQVELARSTINVVSEAAEILQLLMDVHNGSRTSGRDPVTVRKQPWTASDDNLSFVY